MACRAVTAVTAGEPLLRDRLVMLLTSRSGRAICVRCAAAQLGVAHKSAHEAALKVEALPGFRRGYARCAECRKLRIALVDTGAPLAAATQEQA
jgi:hypothetical protein